jgi:hypothetical protein
VQRQVARAGVARPHCSTPLSRGSTHSQRWVLRSLVQVASGGGLAEVAIVASAIPAEPLRDVH